MFHVVAKTLNLPGKLEKRQHGRIDCDGTPCNLGQILDMSASGMKIRCSAKAELEVGDKEWLVIEHEGGDVTVDTLIRRVEKINKKEIVVGLEFIDPSPTVRQALFKAGQHLAEIEGFGPAGC